MKLRELPSSIDWRALRAGIPAACVGLLGVIVLASLMGQATGGLPSRPRFQAVHIGPQTGGALTAGDSRGKLFVATGATLGFDMLSTAPRIRWVDTNATATEQVWDCLADGDAFQCRTRTDVDGGGVNWLTVNRSGTGITTVDVPSGTLQNIGVNVPTHAVVETATSGAAMRVGDSFTVSKSADTARSSTAVSAVDPDLQITSLPAGHYVVEIYLHMTMGAGGWRYQWDAPTASEVLPGVRECNGTVVAELHTSDTDITCAGTAGADYVMVQGGTAKLQATGTVSISWAQNTSNAAATTLQSDSYLRVTRID